MSIRPLLSVHDVMPETLAPVADILARLRRHRLPPATLLVVPGCRWHADELVQLRRWQLQGHELAAHGWRHRARNIRGLHHRLHAALISRDAAEHLALSADEIAELMRRAHDWFARNGLDAPELYVPPAWALGALPRTALRDLPYARVETTAGFIDAASGRLDPVPLVGFEADTKARAAALSAWNRGQLLLARSSGRPLRVGIHPQDFQLRLADALERLLSALAIDISSRRAEPLVGDAP